jgi:hypothetical protein
MGRNIAALSGSKQLNPKQELLALSLASGSSLQDAVEKHGIGLSTAKEWLSDSPAFAARIRELRRQLTERAAGLLADAMADAALTLKKLLSSKSDAIRLRAAEALLAHGREANTLADLQAEVDELKAATAERNTRGNR